MPVSAGLNRCFMTSGRFYERQLVWSKNSPEELAVLKYPNFRKEFCNVTSLNRNLGCFGITGSSGASVFIKSAPEQRNVIRSLNDRMFFSVCLPQVSVLLIVLMIVFSICGVHLLGGKLAACNDPKITAKVGENNG